MTITAFAAVLETSGYIVGDSNARSGLHVRDEAGKWHQMGWPNTRCFGIAVHTSATYLAAGNGVLKSSDPGKSWRVTTGWQITEVLDVAFSPVNPSLVIASTGHGIWKSTDAGATWRPSHLKDETRYSQAVEFDRTVPERVLAAAESTILVSTDAGDSWCPARVDGRPAVRKIAQDPSVPQTWWAVTANQGVLTSEDDGFTWKNTGSRFEAPLYSLALTEAAMAVTGFRHGPSISYDRGQTWVDYEFPDARLSGHALLFEPDGRLLVGTTTDGVFHLDPESGTWTDAGLPEATIRALHPAT